jgi:hypothetical protein
MRPSCQKAFLLLIASTIGCSDSTAPLTLPAVFELENINGRQLPTYFATPPSLTPTVLSASVSLGNAGKAVMSERRRDLDGTETTFTNTYDYRLDGDQIEIVVPCPPNANCIPNFVGTVSDAALSLRIAELTPTYSIIYYYRIAPAL